MPIRDHRPIIAETIRRLAAKHTPERISFPPPTNDNWPPNWPPKTTT